MAFGFETRVATTQQLLVLVDSARELGLNRQVNKDLVIGRVDEDGWHVLSIIGPNHVRKNPPEGATPDPVHHRCQVIMKVRDTKEPDIFVLDVTEDMFKMLGSYEEARASRARAEGSPEPREE